MSLYLKIAEQLQFITPKLYKNRYFKNLKYLSKDNFSQRNVEPELVWVKDFLDENAVIFDIGANVGSFLYQFENKLQHENIYAFEPNKKLYRRLKRLFPEMRIFPFAISDENTIAEFKIPVVNGKLLSSRGTLQTNFKENGEERQITEKVKVIKLDNWAEIESLKRLDFIKIDVEGNEKQTLNGAFRVIKKFKPVLMVEIEQRHHKENIWAFITEIKNWGYEAHFLNREFFRLEVLEENIIKNQAEIEVKNKYKYINNIIFLPKNK